MVKAAESLEARVISIHVGRVAPLGPKAIPSAFVKGRIQGPVEIGPLGLAGDEQADHSVHGGPEQAVYVYPESHYRSWQAEFPEHTKRFIPGSVGENLTVTGPAEDTVALGDVFRFGQVLLQVTDARQPCSKFVLYFDDNRLPKAMIQTGRSGWYLRVLEPGAVTEGERITLAERPNPAWPVARLNRLIATKSATRAEWMELAEMAGVSSRWRSRAGAVLDGIEPRFSVLD